MLYYSLFPFPCHCCYTPISRCLPTITPSRAHGQKHKMSPARERGGSKTGHGYNSSICNQSPRYNNLCPRLACSLSLCPSVSFVIFSALHVRFPCLVLVPSCNNSNDDDGQKKHGNQTHPPTTTRHTNSSCQFSQPSPSHPNPTRPHPGK